jgi:hypothetical protein
MQQCEYNCEAVRPWATQRLLSSSDVAVLLLFLLSIVLGIVTPVSGFVTMCENFVLLIVMKLPECWSVFNWGRREGTLNLSSGRRLYCTSAGWGKYCVRIPGSGPLQSLLYVSILACLAYFPTLKMVVVRSTETSVYQTTRHHISENLITNWVTTCTHLQALGFCFWNR